MLAVALLGAIALGVFKTGLDERFTTLAMPPAVERAVVRTSDRLAGSLVPGNARPEDRRVLQRAIDESFVASFRAVMLTAAGCALVGALCAGLMIDATGRSQVRTRTE